MSISLGKKQLSKLNPASLGGGALAQVSYGKVKVYEKINYVGSVTFYFNDQAPTGEINLNQLITSTPGSFYINWHDGSSIEYYSSDSNLIHNYSSKLQSITLYWLPNQPGITMSRYDYKFTGTTDNDSNINSIFHSCLKSISIQGNNIFTSFYGGFTIPFFSGDQLSVVSEDFGAFMHFTTLESIPSNLLTGCTSTPSLISMFNNSTSLKSIPNNFFDPLTKFSASNLNFTNMFYNCTSLTGTIPELWNLYPNAVGNGGCFYNCTSLSNYSSIPSNWKNNPYYAEPY